MVVIQVQVGKNIVEDVLINGRISVNIITKNLITKLGLPKPRPSPYHLRMVDQSIIRPLGIIRNLKIHIHGILYITTFTVLKNNVVDSNYSMLLGLLHGTEVTMSTIQGNGTIKTILVNKKLGIETKGPKYLFVMT
jgi:hypothetical protein